MPNTTNIFVLGNGESRQGIKLEDLSSHGLIYGCNALYREFAPDMLISVDPAMHNEILATDYQKTIDVTDLSSGIYFIHIKTHSGDSVKKVTIAK